MATSIKLSSGYSMPALGLGTWQAQDDAELVTALNAALKAGYRHIDTAYLYNNENIIGRVLKEWIKRGDVKRDDLFITTKLPLSGMRPEDVPFFLKESLEALQLDYVDMYLIHAPMGLLREKDEFRPEFSNPRNDVTTDHIAVWKAMEAEAAAGRTRSIGVSNFNESQLRRLLAACHTPPANLQVELHVYLQQKGLAEFCRQRNIVLTAYAPLGSPGSTWMTSSTGKKLPDLLGLPEVTKIGKHHKKSSAQVLIRFLLQKGFAVIPKSTNPKRIVENKKVFDFQLDSSEMATLEALDQGDDGRIIDLLFVTGVGAHPEYPFTKS